MFAIPGYIGSGLEAGENALLGVTREHRLEIVQLLRQRDVYFELIVFPDDTHESLLHSRWMYTLGRMETFLRKFLWDTTVAASH